MTYEERSAMNSLLANQFYKNTKDANKSTDVSVGTPMGIDGTTGRTLMISGDGITRTNTIASSSQLGITSPFAKGYNDGRTS